MAALGFPHVWLAIVLVCHLPLFSLAQDLRQQTCTRDNSAIIQDGATAWLGGIISFNEAGSNGYGCGNTAGSMQAYEAIRWVLDLLNKKDERIQGEFQTDYYVPGIKLGMMVKNYCNSPGGSVAALSNVYTQLLGDPDSCTASGDRTTVGIIGPSRSEDAIQLLEQTGPQDIPVVSYLATAPMLTLSGLYKNFMRTISPDGPLMDVIVAVLQELKWQYIAVVYDNDAYGRAAFSELHARLGARDICLTAGIMVEAENLASAKDALDQVLSTEAVGVIYFGPPYFAKELIAQGNANLPAAGRLQWLFADLPIDTSFPTGSVYQRGILSVSAASRFIVEFEDHWIRLNEATHSNAPTENPWFTSWYEERNDCSFNPVAGQRNCATIYGNLTPEQIQVRKRQEYEQDQYVEAAVMSVFTYARALREAQIAKCGTVSGPCPSFRAMTRQDFFENYLSKVNFTFSKLERVPSLASDNVPPYNAIKQLRFDANGDISDPSYFIWNYNNIELGAGQEIFKFRTAGSYINSRLNLNLNSVGMYSDDRQVRQLSLPDSPCPDSGCMPCLGLPADINYYYEPGDIVINGIFSLHEQGMTPLTCGGPMSPNQFQYLQAMIYAINRVNADNSILPNVKLGGLGVDDCMSTTLGQAFLAQVQRGNLRITNSQGGDHLDPRSIEAYTAAYNGLLTKPLAAAMNELKKPMVGYRGRAKSLLEYPYYLMGLPGVNEEIKALIMLLKKWNWNYVQVVNSDYEPYSVGVTENFKATAASEGICVVATHTFTAHANSSDAVVQGLQANENVRPVITLLEPWDARRLLMALNGNPAVRSRLALIGLTRWGTKPEIVEGYETVAEGVLSLRLRRSTLTQFQNHMASLNVRSYRSNPWFAEFYQAVHNCSLSDASVGLPACNTDQPITTGTNYMLVHRVESVINSVYAIARGLDSALRRYCGVGYTSVCQAFSNADKGMVLVDEIKKVTFPIEDMPAPNTFSFADKVAKIPFELYNFRAGQYIKVRDVDPWSSTITGIADIVVYSRAPIGQIAPTCLAPCLECLYMFNSFKYWLIPGDLYISAIFDVHYAGSGLFSCGALRAKNGALYTELFNFALQRINSGRANVQLDNFQLGGLAFDGCTNPYRTTAIINRVHTDLIDFMGLAPNEVIAKKLVAWMTYDSASTIEAAELLRALDMPLVSPGATATELDNKQKYDTFFRTVPSDTVVVRGMAEFVREMNWPYVVVVNSPDLANRESRDLFRSYLSDFGKCVIASYEFETDGTYEIILNSIRETGTQVVVIFSEPDRYVEDFVRTNAERNYDRQIKYIANRPWGEFTKSYTVPGNQDLVDSVYFDLPNPTISDFINYLEQQQSNTNPWFQEIYEEYMNCNLPLSFVSGRPSCTANRPITQSANFEQDIWTLTTLNAVYSVAKAVNMWKVERCGANYQGICEGFYNNNTQNIMANLDMLNFTDISGMFFEFINREANRGFRMRRYTSGGVPFTEGSLSMSGQLSLTNRDSLVEKYANVRSVCQGDCLVCSSTDANMQDFSFVRGEVYIVGLFDVHKKGPTPFTCGAINDKHGLQLLEAFNFAIEYVNNGTGIFRDVLSGIRLGGIGLDMCQSPSRAANLVSNIHSGNVQLVRNGVAINPRRIDAYIATMDTESSIRVADVLTQIAIPQISYGATGMELLDREKYDYFLRSVPADDKQARAIVSYLRKFQYNNIQVIYSFDEIGEPGLEEFEKVALANTICVKKKMLVGESGMITAAEARNAVNALDNNEWGLSQVVVLWMKNPLPILEAANDNDDVSKNYLFIVTDKWGADPEYLKNSELRTLLMYGNLITLDVETADVPGYDLYLENKTPDNYFDDPWFKEYFESLQDCYWDTFSSTYTRPCDKSSTIPRADNYVQDPYVLYVINAVFSAAIGIDNAIKSLCKEPGICNVYQTSGERRQYVMRGLQRVNFTDDTFQPFFYTADGQSDRGFHIYNVAIQRNGFEYKNVGSYNDSHFLKLDITHSSNYVAVCDADGTNTSLVDCICPFPKNQPSRYMKKDDGGRGLTLVYIGDIHQPDHLGCGPINVGPDLHKLLAFFYAIDQVNSNTEFNLPDSIKLNGLALDSCTHGLRLGQDMYNVLSGNQLCDADIDSELITPSSIVSVIIDKDKNAIPVSSMLTEYKITTISPTAGSSMLNDRFMFPYFLRTRGDNEGLADVILQIAQRANWDYVSVIYSDNLSQGSAKNTLLDRSRARSVCVGDAEPLSMTATLSDAEQVLEKISQQVGARGVVLFVEPAHMRLLLQASQSLGLTGRFVWVVPSDWAHDGSNIEGLEQEIAGSIRIETKSAILEDFNNYVKSLTFTNRGGIPDDWFLEIYQTLHRCNVLIEDNTLRRYSRICTQDERITDDMFSQDPAVLHVIISVFATAFGLNEIPECQNTNLELAACLQVAGDRRFDLIYDGISGVNFAVMPDLLQDRSFDFSFDSAGNGQAGYSILNYRATDQSDGANVGSYAAFKIGDYKDSALSLNLTRYAAGNLLTKGTVPSSNCASGNTCMCKLSDGRTWSVTPATLLDFADVQVGGIYEDSTGELVKIIGKPGTTDRFSDAWAIILSVIAGVGAAISAAIFVYLLVMYPVRGGTSILGFILSFGIIFLYLMVFPFIAHADEQICGLRRFGLGFVYAIVYASLMVKLVDCWRVRGKDESYDVKYSKLGRPAGLFMVTLLIVLVQVMINAEWLILREPGMERFIYNGYIWPRCTDHDFYDESLVLSLVYIMVIIVFSLFLGIVTYTSTKNHRESRWILGIFILTIPCWVIWCLVATLGAYKVRDAAVAVGLIINATIMLLLVPVRKLYLLRKYNVLIEQEEEEEEKQSQLAPSYRGTDYNSVYGRQYDNNPRLQDAGSNIGSARGVY